MRPSPAVVPSTEEHTPNNKGKCIRPLHHEPGANASERLAHWLSKVFAATVESCTSGRLSERNVEAIGQRLSDAHLAFSGALWLERVEGVTVPRFLRHKLIEAVIYTGESADTWLPASLKKASIEPTEELVRRGMVAMALTIFSTYDHGRVSRFLKRGHEHFLESALHAVRTKRGRWEALVPLVRAMGLPKPKNPMNLKRDVSRMRRLLKGVEDAGLYRVMPAHWFSYAIEV